MLKRHLNKASENELVSEKELSNAKFYPSTDKPGNIIGSEFPQKTWALTFDDGPGPATTNKILNNLKKHGLKATFFQLTMNAKTHKVVTKNVQDYGMDIASHSYTHQQTPKLTSTQRNYEIKVAAEELSQQIGKPILFYRLPYGAGVNNPDIRTRIAQANMIHVFWNIDTLDWMAQPAADIVTRTIKQMRATPRDAGVILFHDIHERTVIASEEIMLFLKQDNRKVCLLAEIVENMNRGIPPCSGN
jgi:peptidoglycan/xylan/chitin deacetylase (PgdA/CDA1 family)